MAIQMIFCVETNKQAATDEVYISELLSYLYKKDNKVKISYIHMGTKSKYDSAKILKEIKKKSNDYKLGETKVVYFVDTDNFESNYEHEQEYKNVSKFCKKNGYDLVWFCHDIEEVFLGRRVQDSEKLATAAAYRRNKNIENIKLNAFTCSNLKKSTSNIITVLDNYLERK